MSEGATYLDNSNLYLLNSHAKISKKNIEEIITKAFDGETFIGVEGITGEYAELRYGQYLIELQDGEITEYTHASLEDLKNIFFGLIKKYNHFYTDGFLYVYVQDKWRQYRFP